MDKKEAEDLKEAIEYELLEERKHTNISNLDVGISVKECPNNHYKIVII